MIGGFILLYFGGDMLVRGAESLALRLGLTPLIVGLTVVAFGTSSPELFVSISAALDGLGDVAIGNVVGSNICNITLVLGLAALIHPINVQAQLMRIDAPIMILCALLLAALLLDDTISRAEGMILVAGIVIYIIFSIWLARRDKAVLDPEYAESMHHKQPSVLISLIFIIVGLAMLMVGAEFFVGGAVDIARTFGISEAIIGLTLIALGTSLPELATTIIASLKGRGDIAIGNCIGSSIFNILAILGITAIVEPVARGAITWTDIGIMAGVAVLLLPMLFTKSRLSRWEGILLLLCYGGYMALLAARA
jgi:cation:H+ antiporter